MFMDKYHLKYQTIFSHKLTVCTDLQLTKQNVEVMLASKKIMTLKFSNNYLRSGNAELTKSNVDKCN